MAKRKSLYTKYGDTGFTNLLYGGRISKASLHCEAYGAVDEATSALDTESERKVQGAIDNLVKDRTVIVIAHRLSTITKADRIIVLDEGKLVESGTHEELLQKNGKYKNLYDIQFDAGDA